MLGRALALLPGELLASFASRQAATYGTTLAGLCGDHGVPFWDLVRGEAGATAALAAMTGVPAGELAGRTFVGDLGRGRLAGQALQKNDLRLRRLLACPACLREDQARSRGGGTPSAHVRTEWVVRWVTTCPRHGLALQAVDDGNGLGLSELHEVASRLGRHLRALDADEIPEIRREATDLERHVVDRMRGETVSGFPSTLDLDVVANVSEAIGATLRFGRDRQVLGLSEDQLREAAGAGLGVVAAGPDGIRAFLADLQATYPHGEQLSAGQWAVFGGLYRHLSRHGGDAAYAPVVDVVRRYVVETTPVAAGATVLGAPAPARRLHSLRTAAKDLGRPGVRLRAVLGESGLLPPDHAGLNAGHVRFDATAAAPLLAALRDGLLLSAAARRVGVSPKILKLLVAEGLVEHHPMPVGSGAYWAFRAEALDTFLSALAVDARPAAESGGAVQDLTRAALILLEPSTSLTRLVVEGRLAWVGRKPDVHGWSAVLVDVREVGAVLHPEDDGLRRDDLPGLLGLRRSTTQALIDAGVLRARRMVIQGGTKAIDVIDRESLDAFTALHTHHRRFAAEMGVTVGEVMAMIADQHLAPALPPEVYHAHLYRRSELADAWATWKGRPIASDTS